MIEASSAHAALDVETLAEHIRRAGEQGWQLVSVAYAVELARFGRGHVLIYVRRSDCDSEPVA